MNFDRQNILDLIGNYKDRYTSCLITCFTFDFTFFENRVLPILRGSGIKNVNILLDGKHHDYYLENPFGGEFNLQKAYSLNPIYVTGVFHPKILFLTGPKHGLLIIGSGNITTSGLSANDEIWGAFHINSADSANAPVIATLWEYLQQYIRQVNGFNLQKINWIRQYSPWLAEIEHLATKDFIPLQDGMELKFIGNRDDMVTYRELAGSIPKKKIKKLTIVSPYFDENGKMPQQIKMDFDIDEMVCITDQEFGILPHKLNQELRNIIPFYDWRKKGIDYKRLHAKVFHFQYEDNLEYLFLGSANATINAFGSSTSTARNAEAGVLIRRESPNSFLDQLGIDTDLLQPIELPVERKKITGIGDNEPVFKAKIKIPYAEINDNKIIVFLLKPSKEECELVLLDESGNVLESHIIDVEEKRIQIQTNCHNRVYKIYLSSNNTRISNYCLVHYVAIQVKTNPDPTHSALNQIIETLSSNPDQDMFIELFSHIDYNWADEETKTPGAIPFSGGSSQVEKIDKIEKYDPLSEHEFYKLQSIQSRDIEHLNHPNVYIADFLSSISRGLIVPKKSEQENIEEILSRQSEDQQSGEGEIVTQIHVRSNGELEKNAIYLHLSKVTEFFQNKLNELHHHCDYTLIPNYPLSIKQISNLSTGLELIYLKRGEKYSILKTEFKISLDHQKFITDLTLYLSYKDKRSVIKILERFGIEYIEEKSKEGILSELQKKPKTVLLSYIKYLENRYSIKRSQGNSRKRMNICYYEIDTGLFQKFKEEVEIVIPNLIVHSREYKVNTYRKEYFIEGNYSREEKSGIRKFLIDMLGSFLLNTHATIRFKQYDYDTVNGKSISLRNIIFDLSTFLCLNLHWNENKLIYRNLLLLDLLHFVLPKVELDADNILERIELYNQRSKFKSPEFEINKSNYVEKLLADYISWRIKYDHEKELILHSKFNAIGRIGFNSKLGFFLIRNSGLDYILIEKPGLQWNDNYNGNVLSIKYPQSKVIVF